MEYIKYEIDGVTARVALFDEGRREAHAMIESPRDNEAFDTCARRMAEAAGRLSELAGAGMQPVFMRWFVSDAANQTPLPAETKRDCATSVIQQPPLDGSKLALWVIYQEDAGFRQTSKGVWENSRGEIWTGDTHCEPDCSYNMTARYLETLAATLAARGGSLVAHCVRTWFMVRDVDVNYQGVVEGRNDLFDREGLTADTHFIASTGINGSLPDHRMTVAFNAYSDTSLEPGQMTYLHARSHLNPTAEYGVAFERGTAVSRGDRRHVFISGTASIDNRGEIVHPGDIKAQTGRMLDNIEALLTEGGCEWNDVAHLIVYLRDVADAPTVREIFARRFPDIPTVTVLAPVCRPGWLIETECMAIRKCRHDGYAPY
ncbi:MAG: hypothetical protein K2L59_07565 [Muribaculaceae bacterium]|nr:hypothetical protein [Muribaculaceae bacterium]